MLQAIAMVSGLCIGSFLNVVIYRLPRELSLVRPGSACPSCGHRLGSLELVPILSFLVLLGRCRHCGARISWRYPGVELLTGLAFLALYQRYGLTPGLAFFLCYASLLVAIAFIDLDEMLIPTLLIIPCAVLGLLLGLWRGQIGVALLGALIGGGFLLAVYYLARIMLGKEGLGMGDVELAACIGAFLGWQGALLTVFLGSFFGLLAAAGLAATGRLSRGQPMPFGPHLCLAGLLLAVWPWWAILGWIPGFN